MKTILLKSLAFFIVLIIVFYINLLVFRSDMPSLWFVTLIGSVVGLILFPYNKYFKQN